MACSKYEYVKLFEKHDKLLNNTFIVVRLDGNGFTKFSDLHNFEKPNDKNALNLMNESAIHVLNNYSDIFLAYGESDEYSFAFKKETNLFDRRSEKLVSNIVSTFTSFYVYNFEKIMKKKLISWPNFDGRAVCYPTLENLRDYFSWRQVDTHINNLFNTCFWELVKSGINKKEAEKQWSNTYSDYKNELLFTKFNINYNDIDLMFKKGSVIFRSKKINKEKLEKYNKILNDYNKKEDDNLIKPKSPRKKNIIEIKHIDIIKEDFWKENFLYLYK